MTFPSDGYDASYGRNRNIRMRCPKQFVGRHEGRIYCSSSTTTTMMIPCHATADSSPSRMMRIFCYCSICFCLVSALWVYICFSPHGHEIAGHLFFTDVTTAMMPIYLSRGGGKVFLHSTSLSTSKGSPKRTLHLMYRHRHFSSNPYKVGQS